MLHSYSCSLPCKLQMRAQQRDVWEDELVMTACLCRAVNAEVG